MNNFIVVKIKSEYCDYLRKFDDKVYYNNHSKETRPFVGVLFSIEKMEYFAPLSSPKPKHKIMKSSMDFIKIDDGNLGVVNLNNMIPVTKDNYTLVDMGKDNKSKKELVYITLIQEQLDWLNSHYIQIRKKSLKLYKLYNSGRLPSNISKRCCNFKLLEEKCLQYNYVGTT